MPFLAGFVTPQDYGATGNGVTDDTSAINSALAAVFANGGGTVLLPWGTYLISGTISIPPYTFLQGQTGITLNQFSTPGTISRIVASASWAPSSSTGIVSVLSKTPGGWSVNTASCGLSNVFLDGSLNANSNLQGINLVGPVYDVHLDNVFVWKAPHNGLTASGQTESGITPTFPYHQRYTRTSIANSGASGFVITNFTDSTLDNCLAFSNGSDGFGLNNTGNSILSHCRSEWNSGRGFNFSGSSGSIVLADCSTDNNVSEGIRFNTTTGQSVEGGGIVVTGGKYHADGSGGTNNSGMRILSSTVPIVISGVNIESGQNSNNLSYFPANAILIGSSSNVTVTGCVLQGITTAWNDGGGNTNVVRKGCLSMTGNPNTQTTTYLQDLPYGVPQVQSSATTVTGVTAETVLQTYTVPANEPVAGSVYHITGYGVFTAASGNLTWTVRWGGTSGTSIAALPTNAAPVLTNGSFWYDVLLTFRSTTSVTAAINLEINSSTSTDAATSYVETPSTATTVTTTSSTALTVDITPSVAGDSITLMGGCVRKLA